MAYKPTFHVYSTRVITSDEVHHGVRVRSREASYIPAAIRCENTKVTTQSEKSRIRKNGNDQKRNYLLWGKIIFCGTVCPHPPRDG